MTTAHLRQTTQVCSVAVALVGVTIAAQGLAVPISPDDAALLRGKTDCFYTIYYDCDEDDTTLCGDIDCKYTGMNPDNPDFEDNDVWICKEPYQYNQVETVYPKAQRPATQPKNSPGYTGESAVKDYWCYTRTPCALQKAGCDYTLTEQPSPLPPIPRRICRATTGSPQYNVIDVIKVRVAEGKDCKERS